MKQESPTKLYHSISEVAELTGVKAHVLRYWESEFPTLKPRKTRSGSRRYRRQDIEEIEAIKALLYDEGFRIEGARKIRKQAHAKSSDVTRPQLSLEFDHLDTRQQLLFVKDELRGLLTLVQELAVSSPDKVNKGKGS